MRSNIIWCTGKDSNLRTSLGGTDLQSVGFNHSPTCAVLPGDAAVALHPAVILIRAHKALGNPQTARQHTSTLYLLPARAKAFTNLSFCKSGKTNLRIAAKITTRRNSSEWSALEKPVAPPSTSPAACRKFGLEFRFLELAKGFEPLTL